MLYREGMTGSVLFTGAAMVIYFVIGIRYAEPLLFDTPTSIGRFIVLLLITFVPFLVTVVPDLIYGPINGSISM
jgi:uncharacterized membrane protein